MGLPEHLLPHVDPPLDSTRTGGKVVFTDPDGTETSTSIWFVLAETRCWLVAGTTDQHFAVASPHVQLDKGWTWDAVRVGNWSAPLRRGTRGVLDTLLARWQDQPKGGDIVEPPPPPTGEARIANGAEVPEWIAEQVPEDPRARWLFAWESAQSHAFPGREGQPVHRPLWVAVSDRGLWLCSQGGFAQRVERIEEGRRGLREQLQVDSRVLNGAIVDRRLDDLVALAGVDGDTRWGVRLGQLIEQGAMDHAVRLASDAYNLDRFSSCWGWLGALAWAQGRQEDALKAAFASDDPPEQLAAKWTVKRCRVELPGGPFAEVQLPDRPEGMPTAETPLGTASLAAILRDETEIGLTRWDQVSGPRALAARAAVENTAEAWEASARAHREVGEKRAVDDLDRAIALEATPARLYLAGAWAHADHRFPKEYWRKAFPAGPPEGLEQSEDAWRALAEMAEGDGALEPLVAAWRAVGDVDQLVTAGTTLWKELNRPDQALEVFGQVLELSQDAPPWAVRRDVVSLHKQLDQAAEAEDALKSMVADTFLDAEALDAAIDEGEALVDDEVIARWRHLRAQLDGKEAPAPEPRELEREDLDALHPGGVGWLERTRQRLDTAEPPPRSQLVRGLELVTEALHPELAARITTLAGRLGIDAPAVYLFRGEGAYGMSAWPTKPPLVLVGHHHLQAGHAQQLSSGALDFALAVELAHLAANHPLLAFDNGLVGTSRSVYETFGSYAGAAETVVDVLTLLPGVDQIAKLQTLVRLSRRVFTARSVLDKATEAAQKGQAWLRGDQAEAVGRRFEGPALQFRLQADRAAWLVTGDLGAAIEAMILAHPDTADLIGAFQERGVPALLEAEDSALKLRVAGLLGFAASL